jgi:FAD-dependent oxidoreductase domain-containing protein 1
MNPSFDVVIIGGAIMGSSVAYHLLSAEPKLKVAVVERDPTYTKASTPLCLGGVRTQFSLKENILIGQYSMECFSRFEEEMAVQDERPFIDYRQEGYLYLIEPAGEKAAKGARALQKEMGCEVEWWAPEEIRAHFPLIAVESFAGATFGPKDGHLDPYAALMAYRKKAITLGAKYVADEVVGILRTDNRIHGIQLVSRNKLKGGVVVNAAGPWAGEIARLAGIELPVVPISRQVFVCQPPMKLEMPFPLVVLPSHL